MRRSASAFAYAAIAATTVFSACDRKNSAPADNVAVPTATVLSSASARHIGMKFSPNGRQVAYFTPGATGYDLMVAKADLSEPRRLAIVLAVSSLLWSPDGSKLVYGGEFNTSVDVITPADGTVRSLIPGQAIRGAFGWHPHGDRVLFFVIGGQAGILSAKTVSIADGTTARILSDTLPHIAYWSPDGARIAYNLLDGGRGTIRVADSSGRNPIPLTTEGFEDFTNSDSPWSPDGKHLIYSSTRTGTGDIWVIPANGGEARQVTRDIRDDYSPVWSPDGQWIAFISSRGRQTDVWVAPAIGGEAIRVTDDAIEETDLQWIGPGLTLGFSRFSATNALWAVDMAGGAERRLTPDSIRITSFRPSPVNDDVVYVVARGGGVSELRVLSPTTGQSRTLVAGSSEIRYANWSPDGKMVAFVSDRVGEYDIWTVSVEGGEPRQLTTGFFGPQHLEWSPDGSVVYFTSFEESKFKDLWSVAANGGTPTRLTTGGNILSAVAVSPTGELFFSRSGGREGQLELTKVTTDGDLQVVWDRGTVDNVSSKGFTPSGDSVVIVSTMSDGVRATFFISTRTGQGRRVLGDNERGGDLTDDGTQLIYTFGSPKTNIGILDLRDGTKRQITTGKDSYDGYWLSADGTQLIVTQAVYQQAIVTVDMKQALSKR